MRRDGPTHGYRGGKRVWLPLYTTDEVRRHIVMLHDGGMSYLSIARLAGVAKSDTIGAISAGQTSSVNIKTAEGVLGITLDDRNDYDRVPSAMALRLIKEASANGVPTTVFSTALKFQQHRNIWTMCNPKKNITKRQYDKVACVYRALAREGKVPASLLEEAIT